MICLIFRIQSLKHAPNGDLYTIFHTQLQDSIVPVPYRSVD